MGWVRSVGKSPLNLQKHYYMVYSMRNYVEEFGVLHGELCRTRYNFGWKYATTLQGGTIYLNFGDDTEKIVQECGLESWPRRMRGVKLYSCSIKDDPHAEPKTPVSKLPKARRVWARWNGILVQPFVFRLWRKRDVSMLEQIKIISQRMEMDAYYNERCNSDDYEYEYNDDEPEDVDDGE